MYRYKLKPKDKHSRRSVRGTVITKDRWVYFKQCLDLKTFQDMVIEEQSELNVPNGHIEMIEGITIPKISKKREKKEIIPEDD